MRKIVLIFCILFLSVMFSSCNKKDIVLNTTRDKITFAGGPSMAVINGSTSEKYLEEKFDVDIEPISITSNYYDKLATLFASNNIPDVMFIGESSFWKPLADQNIIASIDFETIKKYAPKHYSYINNYEKKLWRMGEYKKKFYAIPKTMGKEYNTVMVWRKDWLDAVGIEKIPNTILECEEAFKRFRHNDPDKNGAKDTYALTGLGGSSWRQFDAIFGAYGVMPGQWKLENNELIDCTVSNKAREVLVLLNKWYEMELIDPELITDTVETVGRKFELGRIGVMNTGLGNISDKNPRGKENLERYKKNNPDSFLKRAYGGLPLGPNNDRGDWLWGPLSNFVVFGVQMQDNVEKQAEILTMLDDINYNPETAVKVIYGEKGRTFDYNDNSIGGKSGIKFLPPYDLDVNERAKEGVGAGNFFNLFSPLGGNWADTDIVKMYSNDEYIAENDRVANWGNYRDALMRVTLPSSARFQATLEKIKTTNYSSFITGQKPLSEWDSFVNEYLDNGGRVLQDEAVVYYNENFRD